MARDACKCGNALCMCSEKCHGRWVTWFLTSGIIGLVIWLSGIRYVNAAGFFWRVSDGGTPIWDILLALAMYFGRCCVDEKARYTGRCDRNCPQIMCQNACHNFWIAVFLVMAITNSVFFITGWTGSVHISGDGKPDQVVTVGVHHVAWLQSAVVDWIVVVWMWHQQCCLKMERFSGRGRRAAANNINPEVTDSDSDNDGAGNSTVIIPLNTGSTTRSSGNAQITIRSSQQIVRGSEQIAAARASRQQNGPPVTQPRGSRSSRSRGSSKESMSADSGVVVTVVGAEVKRVSQPETFHMADGDTESMA